MRLQKRLSRKIGKKEYVKWVVTIPPEDIKRTGWEEGQNLEVMVTNDGLLIKKSHKVEKS